MATGRLERGEAETRIIDDPTVKDPMLAYLKESGKVRAGTGRSSETVFVNCCDSQCEREAGAPQGGVEVVCAINTWRASSKAP